MEDLKTPLPWLFTGKFGKEKCVVPQIRLKGQHSETQGARLERGLPPQQAGGPGATAEP